MVTSAFYAVSFFATRGLLGWSSTDPLPPKFKLLGAGSLSRTRSRAIPAPSICGSRRSTTTTIRAACLAPIVCPMTSIWPRRRRPRSGRAPTASRRAVVRRISAMARAACRRRPRARSRHRRSPRRRRRSFFRRSGRPRSAHGENQTINSRRSPRHACPPRTRNSGAFPLDGAPAPVSPRGAFTLGRRGRGGSPWRDRERSPCRCARNRRPGPTCRRP